MLIDICMKFRKDSLWGFQVTERTRFVTDRQTDVPTFIFLLDILYNTLDFYGLNRIFNVCSFP